MTCDRCRGKARSDRIGIAPATFQIKQVAVIGAGVAGAALHWPVPLRKPKVILEDVMPARLRHAEAEYVDAKPWVL